MDDAKIMNVLVLGNSGAGKSTLIKAISGAEIETGVGEGQTSKITVYKSSTWPICCIDTKGFEYNIVAQFQTIRQITKFTKAQMKKYQAGDEDGVGIDAVWYCIDGVAKRTFSYNIEMMNKAIRKWKDVPVFAVITKSFSQVDIPENIDAVSKVFARGKGVNLQKIIPVVAEQYRINDEFVVAPMGIDALCDATLACSAEAKRISTENRKRMILEQKRFTAHTLVGGAATAGVAIGAVPTPFADSLVLVPLETGLTKGLFKIYGIEFTGELISAIVGSTAISNLARAVLSSLKAIPNIAGSVLNGVVAGFFVASLGEAVIALAEAIYIGKVDKDKIDSIIEFITQKLSDNAVFSFVVKYLEQNIGKMQGKSSIEIFSAIDKAIKEKENSEK